MILDIYGGAIGVMPLFNHGFCAVNEMYCKNASIAVHSSNFPKQHSLHCTVQSCGSEFSNFNHLGRVQRITTRPVRGQINLFLLGWRCLQDNLNLAFKIFKSYVELIPSDFFLRPPRSGFRDQTVFDKECKKIAGFRCHVVAFINLV